MPKTVEEVPGSVLFSSAARGSALSPYSADFYGQFSSGVRAAAALCVPEIIRLLKIHSVVDVGCGIGEWLAEFARVGIEDYLGIDGPHVQDHQLLIPAHHFRRQDLTKDMVSDRRFDLALSLEVAEHLPNSCADQFVRLLTDLAPAVVFSAAIPGQGGVHHVNEQWHWYWHEKFASFGFVYLDPFRKQLWQNPQVPSYYQQNMFLYVDPKIHQPVVALIGQPSRLNELTLIRTANLRSLVEGSRLRRWLARAKSKLSTWFII